MSVVKSGDLVRIHYTTRRQDSRVIDSSSDAEPFEFTAGSGEVIEGVSMAVLGMRAGESKILTIAPAAAYGLRKPGLEQRLPRQAIPDDVGVGDPVEVQIGDGRMVLWVTELGGDYVILDANHPLAGETLELEVEVLSIELRAEATGSSPPD